MAKALSQLGLGGAWAVRQGCADARALAILALDLGFGALVPAPGPRRFGWDALRATTEDLPIDAQAIRVDPPAEVPDGSLASARADDVLSVRSRIERAAALGAAISCNVLILELPLLPLSGEDAARFELALPEGRDPDAELFSAACARMDAQRDAALERCCRNLHGILRELPDFRIALTESANLVSLSRSSDVEAILDDLAGLGRLGYWHRPSVATWHARAGGVEHGARLEAMSKYLLGMDLGDFGDRGPRSVPGSGIVDYALIAPYMRTLGNALPLCLEPEPSVRSDEVRQGRAFLGKFGL